jgi:hypothetical protein
MKILRPIRELVLDCTMELGGLPTHENLNVYHWGFDFPSPNKAKVDCYEKIF